MRCGKCSYYFCWICGCGGEGMQCGSYVCKSRMVNTFSEDTDSHSFFDRNKIPSQLQMLAEYADADAGFNDLLKRSNNDPLETAILQAKEIQLRQMLLWSSAVSLSKYDSPDSASLSTIRYDADQLKAVLHLFVGEDYPVAELERNLIFPPNRMLSTKKHLSTQAKSEMQRELEHDRLCAREATEIISAAILRSLDSKSMYISQAINRAYEHIARPCRSQRQARKSSTPEHIVSILNERAKPIKASWKNNGIWDDEEKEGVHNANSEVDTSQTSSTEKRLKWKGKHIVKARRQMALFN